MEHIQCIVIGAGVVGLAVARAMARSGKEVLVLEAAAAIGTGVSSRNSEVIHAGLYYQPGSLKAQLCTPGQNALYSFCKSHGVAHKRIGKLVVITDQSQRPALLALGETARANGVEDLQLLSRSAIHELEPELDCPAALLSPATGIISAHEYMLALQGDAEDHGAIIALQSPCTGGDVTGRQLEIEVGEGDPLRLRCDSLINCAALGAQTVAHGLSGLNPATIPQLYYAKGNYFSLKAPSPFQRLIYPLPVSDWLGVHATGDLSGRCKFGPDLHWVDSLDYTPDESRLEAFYAAIRRWWPGLPAASLQADYAGIRPKLYPQGQPAVDFQIHTAKTHGVQGLINLFGIESPGLTASLAIADYVQQAAGAL